MEHVFSSVIALVEAENQEKIVLPLTKRTIARLTNAKPKIRIIPAQNTNHSAVIVMFSRYVDIRKLAPSQNTMFSIVSAFRETGE